MYVKRNQHGSIIAISQQVEGDVNEFVDDNVAELQHFIASLKTSTQLTLERSDQSMARVLEDVINVLVDKGTIRFTDLPDAAQTKLLSRRELRGQKHNMDLLDDGDNLGL